MQKLIDSRGSQRLGHQLVEAGWMDLRVKATECFS